MPGRSGRPIASAKVRRRPEEHLVAERKRTESSFNMKLKVNSSDYPALCEALQSVPAGRRRTLRLLTLAHVGALFERTPTLAAAPADRDGADATPQRRRVRRHCFSTDSPEQLADLRVLGQRMMHAAPPLRSADLDHPRDRPGEARLLRAATCSREATRRKTHQRAAGRNPPRKPGA